MMDHWRFVRRYEELRQQLAQIGYICKGTVMSLHRSCGKPNCGCTENAQMKHGPYNVWTRKEKGKTVTRSLSEKQAERCSAYIQNFKRMESFIEEMKEISARMIEQTK